MIEWQDNENNRPANEILWTDWISTQNFFDAGSNATLSFSEQVTDMRDERCNMLDSINHYMLH